MEITELKKIESLHHAYVVEAPCEEGVSEVLKLLESRKVAVQGNVDLKVETFADLSVDDARRIQKFIFYNAIGEGKYCVLGFETINVSAQNALLKVLEEAPGKTTFFLVTPMATMLLPTIRSRVITVGIPDNSGSDTFTEAKKFIKLSPAERLTEVEGLIAKSKKADDSSILKSFVSSLLAYSYREAKGNPQSLQSVYKVQRAQHLLRQQGCSPKLILTNLAVTL